MVTQIVFFGSSALSNIVLHKFFVAKVNVLAVVTTEDKPAGRHLQLTPNPVKALATEHNLTVFDNIADYLTWSTSQNLQGVVGICVAYKKIIGPKTRATLNNRIYNIHPSLLPKYRGPAPLQFQILDGLAEAGYTVYQLDELEDHGPIVFQDKLAISPTETTITLGDKLFGAAADKLLDSNFAILDLPPQVQDESQVSDTRLLTRDDGFVPWTEFKSQVDNQSPELDRKLRAYWGWPGIWTTTPDGKRLKLINLIPRATVQSEGKSVQSWADLS